MNRRIIIDYAPFQVLQNIMVYEDGVCTKQALVPIDRVNDVVKGFVKAYNINEITMCGNTDFLLRFKEEMLNSFSENECHIEIINK